MIRPPSDVFPLPWSAMPWGPARVAAGCLLTKSQWWERRQTQDGDSKSEWLEWRTSEGRSQRTWEPFSAGKLHRLTHVLFCFLNDVTCVKDWIPPHSNLHLLPREKESRLWFSLSQEHTWRPWREANTKGQESRVTKRFYPRSHRRISVVANHCRPQKMCSHESHSQSSEEQEQARRGVSREDQGPLAEWGAAVSNSLWCPAHGPGWKSECGEIV